MFEFVATSTTTMLDFQRAAQLNFYLDNVTVVEADDGNGYRFSFNGMEADNELKNNGNSYTTFFREYNPMLGMWFSLDPNISEPWNSPYVAFICNPVYYSDPRGNRSPEERLQHQINKKGKKYRRKIANIQGVKRRDVSVKVALVSPIENDKIQVTYAYSVDHKRHIDHGFIGGVRDMDVYQIPETRL